MKKQLSTGVVIVSIVIVVLAIIVVGYFATGKSTKAPNVGEKPPGAPTDGETGGVMTDQQDAMRTQNRSKVKHRPGSG